MSVPRETLYDIYIDLLTRWGGALNLTSKRDAGIERLRLHIADSLSVVPHLPRGLTRLIDLGSGQGFPAIPIGIETGIAVEMIESDRRKSAFLTSALAKLGLRGKVWPTRIEQTRAPPAQCVTARALAPVAILADLARPFVTADGICLFLKGPSAQAELDAAALADPAVATVLSGATKQSCLVKIAGLG